MDIQPLTAPPSLTLKRSNAVAYAALLAVNIASQSGLLGPNNKEISDKFITPLTPAGWAFSIWGLIFGLQGLGVVYQQLPHGYDHDGWKARVVNTIGYQWQIGWAFEVLWQLFFLRAPKSSGALWICAALLLGALFTFGTAMVKLLRLKDQYGSLHSPLLYAAFFLPTTVNTAWLSVATAVGVLMVPLSAGIQGLDVAAVILAALVTGAGVVLVQLERDTMYALTLIWALLAVYGKQQSPLVRGASLVCISVCFLSALFSVLRRRQFSGGSIELNEDVRKPLHDAARREEM